jgi:glutathione S-transferase
MHFHAALITTLNVVILAIAVGLVGRARGKFQIHAPATTGNVDFERVFRAHQNTIESTVMFLPVLWLATLYCNEQIASWFGYARLAGRFWYLFGYASSASARSMGFLIAAIAFIGLLIMSICAVVTLWPGR